MVRTLFHLATVRNSVIQLVRSDDRYDTDDYEEVEVIPPDSVLDVYRQVATLGRTGSQGLNALGQLTAWVNTFHEYPVQADSPPNRKPDGHLMLDTVRSILSSGRPDDAISGELAELIGFDELDLVSDILNNRGQFFEEPRIINEARLTPLPSKGKGKEIGRSSQVSAESAHSIAPDTRSLAPDQARRRMEEQLQANASRPLYTGVAVSRIVPSSHEGPRVELESVA